MHISGPSRVHDDKKYRKQARGLQAFDGVTRERIHTFSKRARPSDDDVEENSRSKRQRKEQGGKEATDELPARRNGRDSQQNQELSHTTQESTPSFDKGFQKYGSPSSEADLITSSLDSNTYCQVVRARALTHPRTVSAPSSASQESAVVQVQRSASDSFDTLASVIPDSQLSQRSSKRERCIEESQIVDRESLTRRKRQRRNSSPLERSARGTTPSSVGDDDGAQTPRLKDVSPNIRKAPAAGATKYAVNPACTSGAGSSDEHNVPTSQNPRDEQAHEPSLQLTHPLAQPTSTPRNWQVIHTFRPPAPETSGEVFTTHITDFLHKFIDRKLSVARRYQPSFSLRSVDPLERGRWEFILPAESWDVKKRQRFLREVDNHTKLSKAGWGTWCQIIAPALDPDETIGESTAERRQQREERLEQDWLIRMWCWGEAIGHIYLFLYLLTATAVKGLGAVWIDADGEVVVRMA